MKEKENIREYGNWLNTFHWDCYGTLTARYSLTQPHARSLMSRVHNYLKNDFPNANTFFAIEPFDTKYGFHTHALIALNSSNVIQPEKYIKKAWRTLSTGKSDIQPYIKDKGAHFYVAKYIFRNNADFDLLL